MTIGRIRSIPTGGRTTASTAAEARTQMLERGTHDREEPARVVPELTLRDALKVNSISVSHSESLELVARTLGFHDWNVLSAAIQSSQPVSIQDAKLRARSRSAGTAIPSVWAINTETAWRWGIVGVFTLPAKVSGDCLIMMLRARSSHG